MGKAMDAFRSAQEADAKRKYALAQDVIFAAVVLDRLCEAGAQWQAEVEGLVRASVELVGVHSTNKILNDHGVKGKLNKAVAR